MTVTTIRVRYAETDRQGVAYHGHYFVWMEIGRTALLEELGFPYRRLEEEGLFFSVVAASCRYGGQALYDDRVEVRTTLTEVRSRAAVFGYELSVGERRIASGETTLIALDGERRPRRIPDSLARALRARLQSEPGR
ncbi:MAG TPA: thioesterase family protein [Gemmatimonadota bacterium]|nr:thioesterase family protein [Gemmatimonadota bacterium]